MKAITLDEKTKDEFLKAVIAQAVEQLNIHRGIPAVKIDKKLTADLPKPTQNAIINFNPMAWLKMRTQVNNSKDECAWHGVVEVNKDRTIFEIKDILVYPQRINGMTVEDDDPTYEVWHQSLDNYNYNHLRLQGHSHVNSAATPSSRDSITYNNLLQALSSEAYYIFMITNKQGNMWFNIYDLKNNCIWEQADIDVLVGGLDLYAWFKEISDTFYAKPKTIVYSSYTKPIPSLEDIKEKAKQNKGVTKGNSKDTYTKTTNNAAPHISEMDAFFAAENGEYYAHFGKGGIYEK